MNLRRAEELSKNGFEVGPSLRAMDARFAGVGLVAVMDALFVDRLWKRCMSVVGFGLLRLVCPLPMAGCCCDPQRKRLERLALRMAHTPQT